MWMSHLNLKVNGIIRLILVFVKRKRYIQAGVKLLSMYIIMYTTKFKQLYHEWF